VYCIKGNFSESFKPFSILKSTREEGVPEKSIKMMKASFTILFSFLIFITIINGKPFYRPMPGLIHRTLNKILTKQINGRFSTNSVVEPTKMPILVPFKSELQPTKSNPLNKIQSKQIKEKSITKTTVEPIRLPTLVSKSKFDLKSTKSNPLAGLKSKVQKTGKMPIVILQSKSGFQLLTQLTESRKFKSTESTQNPLILGPKSTIPQTKLPSILQSKSGVQTFQNFPELKQDPTSTPKTSLIRSTTKESQNDLPDLESTKSELNSKKHQITRAKSEKLSVPQARYKLWKPKKYKICYLQFFEKCTFDEWSKFLNSNKHALSLFRLNF
jgi:hypothetical protein